MINQYDLYYDKYLETWHKAEPTLSQGYKLYDYNLSPHSNDYFQLFKFIHDNIHSEWKEYGLGPCYFFFNDSPEVQAKAIQQSRVITIYSGLFNRLTTFFKRYQDFLQNRSISDQPILFAHFNPSIVESMQAIALMFCYYHEIAHIVQITHNCERTFTENREQLVASTFHIDDHIAEIDSDEMAANHIFDQIMGLWRLAPFSKNQESFEMFLANMLAGIYLLFYVLSGERIEKIYYEEKEHPHNYLRLVKITGILLERAKTAKLTSEINLERNRILNLCFEVVRSVTDESVYDHFKNTLRDEQSHFKQYFEKIITESKGKLWLAGEKISAYQTRKTGKRKLMGLILISIILILTAVGVVYYLQMPEAQFADKEKDIEYPVVKCISKPTGLDQNEYVQVKALFTATDIKNFEIHLFAFDKKNYSYNCLKPSPDGKVVESYVKVDKGKSEFDIHVITTSVLKNAKLNVLLNVLSIKGDTLGKFNGVITTPLIARTYELEKKVKFQLPINENPPLTSTANGSSDVSQKRR
jgi:hypothetical protein